MQEQLAELQPLLARLHFSSCQPTSALEGLQPRASAPSTPTPPAQPPVRAQSSSGGDPAQSPSAAQQPSPDLDTKFGLSAAARAPSSACVVPSNRAFQQQPALGSMSKWPQDLLRDLAALLPSFPDAEPSSPAAIDQGQDGPPCQTPWSAEAGQPAWQQACTVQAEPDQVRWAYPTHDSSSEAMYGDPDGQSPRARHVAAQ